MSTKAKAARTKSTLQCPRCVYASQDMSAFIKHLMQVHAVKPNEVPGIVTRAANRES
jgi:uncharacterized C2H2 Zn-finger protein